MVMFDGLAIVPVSTFQNSRLLHRNGREIFSWQQRHRLRCRQQGTSEATCLVDPHFKNSAPSAALCDRTHFLPVHLLPQLVGSRADGGEVTATSGQEEGHVILVRRREGQERREGTNNSGGEPHHPDAKVRRGGEWEDGGRA